MKRFSNIFFSVIVLPLSILRAQYNSKHWKSNIQQKHIKSHTCIFVKSNKSKIHKEHSTNRWQTVKNKCYVPG